MNRYLLTLVIVFLSTGCGSNKAGVASSGYASRTAEKPETHDRGGGFQAPTGETQISASRPGDPVSYLAYAYGIRLELPGDRLIGVMDQHATACRDAGVRVCQLVASAREGDPLAALRGSLSLRAEPQWLQRFLTTVQSDAIGAAGRVTSQWTSTEDLTRTIVDTEATLRAKRTLRDRLQQLLATRSGSLTDLLGVERELARVQGEIDASESNLAATRTRVAMSALTIEYGSTVRGVAGGVFEPLRHAFADFIVAVVESAATLVTVVGALLPWVAVATLAVGLLIRRRRRARRTRSPEPTAK
jgi:hypothetical protein